MKFIRLAAPSSPKITTHFTDVSDPELASNMIRGIVCQHSKIDSLVASAGF
jgi:NADP-dependent 3-hydroxy acid dehydrogenase YdfG